MFQLRLVEGVHLFGARLLPGIEVLQGPVASWAAAADWREFEGDSYSPQKKTWVEKVIDIPYKIIKTSLGGTSFRAVSDGYNIEASWLMSGQ